MRVEGYRLVLRVGRDRERGHSRHLCRYGSCCRGPYRHWFDNPPLGPVILIVGGNPSAREGERAPIPLHCPRVQLSVPGINVGKYAS